MGNRTNVNHYKSNIKINREYKIYFFGCISSILLTFAPFIIIINNIINKNQSIKLIFICAIIQIIIHLICFLHINTSSGQIWNLVVLLFTLLIIVILVTGSLWIMWHLDNNLMNH